jgi:sortase B
MAALALCFLAVSWRAASAPAGSPDLLASLGDDGKVSNDAAFRQADWAAWQAENADVIGWITVPGTGIDQPVVRADASEPDFYLSHDVHRRANPWGAIYLDADCREGLLGSPNAVVCGHHMDDGTMFAPVARYGDSRFAREHSEVLLQTPGKQVRARVFAVEVVNASTEPKRTSFADADEQAAWLREVIGTADVVLPDAESLLAALSEGDQSDGEELLPTVTLCTCSYGRWENQRTLVHCWLGAV